MKSIINIVICSMLISFGGTLYARNSGSDIYAKHCAVCHQPNGGGINGAFPSLKTSKIVKGPMSGMVSIVVKGKSGTSMQAFGTRLGVSDLASVISFSRSTFGGKKINKKKLNNLVKKEKQHFNKKLISGYNKHKSQITDLGNISSPERLFRKSRNLEKTNILLAIEGFTLVIKKYPDSRLAIKSIDHLNAINRKFSK